MKDLELADTGSSDDIKLLIGSDFCRAFVTGNIKLGKVGEPLGVESKFEWLLNGPVPKQQSFSTLPFKWTRTKATECFDKP